MASFAISYSDGLRPLFSAIGLGPRYSRVDVDQDTIHVHMGWGFWARFPRSAVVSAVPYDGPVYGWGAHGWGGRWLVNGSSRGIVAMQLAPAQRARVLGFPVKLRELRVSVDDRAGLLQAVT
jgi:hypothetical protein